MHRCGRGSRRSSARLHCLPARCEHAIIKILVGADCNSDRLAEQRTADDATDECRSAGGGDKAARWGDTAREQPALCRLLLIGKLAAVGWGRPGVVDAAC